MQPPKKRGQFAFEMKTYGVSEEGVPLRYFPCEKKCRILVIAGIHGEEADTTFLLSRTLRLQEKPFKHVAAVLSANPDGMLYGLRANRRGVDLNRNFPTKNWKADPVYSRWIVQHPAEIELSPGINPGSEKETTALIRLIHLLQPKTIIALHSPLACIDCFERSERVQALEKIFKLQWIADIGYPTPGSLGSWCRENHLECITLELPSLPLEELISRYAEDFSSGLQHLSTI